MSRGFFITFEGLDGSGKSTQIKRLAAWLEGEQGAVKTASGIGAEVCLGAPLVTRQPGGTAIGDRMRALALDSRGTPLAPMAEMALMFADRAQAIAEVIRPALEQGRVVICDRFTDSTEAYQGGGRGLGSEIVRELHHLICGDLQPDLTLMLLPSLESSLARAQRRNERAAEHNGRDEGRFEREQIDFHRRVLKKYHEIAERECHRVALIEGDLSIDQVHKRIVELVAERLGMPVRE
ncbi:MAG TPA: dTMP kinase [Terracidiphilus sp.]|nr:dTMP kinase [Terracidiphilus sp.]